MGLIFGRFLYEGRWSSMNEVLFALALGFTFLNVVPPIRHWLGRGMHTPGPDEREQLINLYASQWTLNTVTGLLMLAAFVMLVFFPGNDTIVKILLLTTIATLYLPMMIKRWLNARM